MNKLLRCIILSSLFVMSMVASVLAAPYDPPVAIATPPIDRALLAALVKQLMVRIYVLPSRKMVL